MATYTSYLNLEKPTTSETFNLLKMNQNWDKIDQGVSALNSKFVNSYGDLATGISYQKYGKIVIIYFNGATVSDSSGWTDLITLPENLSQSRYSMHAKAMTGQDIRIASGNIISYRGSAGDIFGTIAYIMS